MSFIFQALPEHYDLSQKLVEGNKAFWIASRYRDEMRKDEVVYFWQGGDIVRRGLYGWGVISGNAAEKIKTIGYRIWVEYRCSFLSHNRKTHIPSEVIRKNHVLQNHLIFRLPMGTNFILDAEQDQALRTIIAQECGNDCVPPSSIG